MTKRITALTNESLPALDDVFVIDNPGASGTRKLALNALLRMRVITVTGTTVTLDDASHNGATIVCTHASGCTVTVPGSLSVGFNCAIVQAGAGTVTLDDASGVTFKAPASASSPPETAEQDATITVLVRSSGGGNIDVQIGGNLAS